MTTEAPVPVCEACGCSEAAPCPEGCAWDSDHLAVGRFVCTACAVLPPAALHLELVIEAVETLGIPPAPYVRLPGDLVAELPA